MKWFFILLLLMNVLYFGWELDRQTRMEVSNRSSLPKMPGQAKRLQFLEELETPPPLRNTEIDSPLETISEPTDLLSTTTTLNEYEAVAEDDIASDLDLLSGDSGLSANKEAKGSGACFSFGPIADENQATGLHNWFASHGGTAQTRHTDEQGRQLFWVYLSPQESRQDAMATIRSFQDKGVRDFRLIVKGNLQNAISMGLFSSQATVNKRLSELNKKGYKPVVVPYSDGKRVYWVDAKLPDDGAVLGKVFSDYPSRFSSILVNCAEIAIALDYS